MTVNDLWHISRSLDCFTSSFSKTVCDTAKVTTNRISCSSFRLVPLLMTFEGHFSLGWHFYVHFSNLWQAFASRGLPASWASCFRSLRPLANLTFATHCQYHGALKALTPLLLNRRKTENSPECTMLSKKSFFSGKGLGPSLHPTLWPRQFDWPAPLPKSWIRHC